MDSSTCSELQSSPLSIGGMHNRPRSCWKMKTQRRFHLAKIVSRGASGRSIPNGCNIVEGSLCRSAVAASTSRARICALSDFSDHHEGHEGHEDSLELILNFLRGLLRFVVKSQTWLFVRSLKSHPIRIFRWRTCPSAFSSRATSHPESALRSVNTWST